MSHTNPRALLHEGRIANPVLRSLTRFLLPNCCICCDRKIGPDRPDEVVCRVCVSRMRRARVGCATCAQPLPPVGPCRLCETWPDGVRCRSAVWLDFEARELVHRLKYGGFTRLGACAAEAIAREIDCEVDILVPLPLGRRRFRVRGYNQSAYIARALGDRWALPVAEDLLVRRRETRSQTRLTPAERLANVRDAFLALRRPENQSNGSRPARTIGIVDDVFTTGATIVEAATALRRNGWQSVTGITFARARTFADVVSLGK